MIDLRSSFEGKLSDKGVDFLSFCYFDCNENRYFYLSNKQDDYSIGLLNGSWITFQELNK